MTCYLERCFILISLLRGDYEWMKLHKLQFRAVISAIKTAKCAIKVRFLSSSNWRKEILEYAVPESLPDKWNLSETIFTSSVPVPVKFDEKGYFGKNTKVCFWYNILFL